jgi:uncharacterized protein
MTFKLALYRAVKDNDLASFCEHFDLIDLESEEYSYAGSDFTLLALAADAESAPLDIVRFLVESGADINRTSGMFHAPAVTYAARQGNLEILKFLVDSGAILDISFVMRNPLLLAAEEGHLEVVKYLLTTDIDRHACYLLPTGALINALSEAENHRQKEVAELLKTHGCRRPIKGVDIPVWQPDQEDMHEQSREFTRYREIIDYMEERFGPADTNGIQELLPPIEGMSVAINVIQPNDEHPFLVLFTNGMSDLPMKVPPGQEEWQYAELVIQLPPDWVHPRDANGDPQWMWPVRYLREMAYHPHRNHTWLGRQVAIVSSGEPLEPLGPNTKQTCLLLFADYSNLKPPLRRADGGCISSHSYRFIQTSATTNLNTGCFPFLSS